MTDEIDIVGQLMKSDPLIAAKLIGKLFSNPLGQIFSWHDDDGLLTLFDVSAGMQIVYDEKVTLEINEVEDMVKIIESKQGDIDIEYAEGLTASDLSMPLLVVPHKGKDLLIDGYHRLWRLVDDGTERVLIYFLTEEQTAKIILGQGHVNKES